MMKQWGNKVRFMVLLFVPSLYGTAQSFRYQAMLDTIRQTGFYAIPVSPELSVHMQTDFRDVRIWDAKDKQVPYIVRSRRPQWQQSLFQPFPLIENRLDDSGRSVIVVQKNISVSISGLSLILKNASVSRYAALSGSDDGKKWFIISEQLLINDSYETGTDSSIQSVSFPLSSYPFYRIIVNNHKNDPLNIVSIGYYPLEEHKSIDPYVENKAPHITQTDSSNGSSYIKVIQPNSYPVSYVQLKIAGPKYYSRQVSVALPLQANRRQNMLQPIATFDLSSNRSFQTNIPLIKAAVFYILIENGDNPPLQIQSVETAQEYHELIAYLEAGKPYKLMMDATDATAPHYDLQQFSDSIPVVIPTIAVREIMSATAQVPVAEAKPFPRLYIWLIMLGIVALLGLLTWRLTAEMRKNV